MANKKYIESWRKKDVKRQQFESKEVKDQKAAAHFKKNYSQSVTVICNKSMMLPKGVFRSFSVRLTVPLRKKEIDERVRLAFPELEWRLS